MKGLAPQAKQISPRVIARFDITGQSGNCGQSIAVKCKYARTVFLNNPVPIYSALEFVLNIQLLIISVRIKKWLATATIHIACLDALPIFKKEVILNKVQNPARENSFLKDPASAT